MTELSTLERKRLSDLHQIASQLGIEQYRKYRKPELAQLIYKVATEQAAEQAAGDGEAVAAQATNGGTTETREATSAAHAPVMDGFGETDTVAVEDATEVEKYRDERRQEKGQEQTQQRQERGDRGEELIQSGVLDVLPDGFGFLRTNGYSQSKGDVYVSTSQIKRFNLRRGDFVVGQIRPARDGEKYPAMVRIETVNGKEPQKGRWRPTFDDLTPLYPLERLRLEWKPNDIAPRVIDLVAPIGKGQRGLVVSPPKAGKTTILKQIAQAVAELVLERVKRLVEEGEDVVVLLDGITRLSRAYNLAAPASGRILSGGVDSAALYPPKKFFGAARNIENGGSLTILATALVETGSRMDEVIFEEFKGTGNMELRLDRKMANRRIYPAINIEDSGTRKEELLMESGEAQRVWQVRSILNALDSSQKIELLIQKLKETRTNAEFLRELQRVR